MSNEITTVPKNEKLVVVDDSGFESYLDTAKFEQTYRVANLFAKSDLVPAHYKNKPENCMIAVNWAMRLNIDPLMLLQKTYIIHGKPGIEAQLVIALVNARGPFTGPIRWRFAGEGKTRACTAYATHKETGDVCESTITWTMVEAEGWASKAGSKWKTIPDQMFQYRSAVFLARLYCPETILGFSTAEELRDIDGNTPAKPERPASSLEERLSKPVENVAIGPEAKEGCGVPAEKKPVVLEKETPATTEAPSDNPPPEPTPSAKQEVSNPPEEAVVPAEGVPQQVINNVAPEERYMCNSCNEVFAEPAGAAGDLCRLCLSKDFVDRWA